MKTNYLHMNRFFCIFIILISFSVFAFGQAQSTAELSVAERNAAQGFNDTIDRLDPDFVLVSLCVADPTESKDDALGMNSKK